MNRALRKVLSCDMRAAFPSDHTVPPADSRGCCGRKTQRNRKAERLPRFIKGSQGTGSPSVPRGNCLGIIWKLVVALVNLGGTPPYIST